MHIGIFYLFYYILTSVVTKLIEGGSNLWPVLTSSDANILNCSIQLEKLFDMFHIYNI